MILFILGAVPTTLAIRLMDPLVMAEEADDQVGDDAIRNASEREGEAIINEGEGFGNEDNTSEPPEPFTP